jgi:ISXO2-like transposase domain/Transposase zinc-ribbon domain
VTILEFQQQFATEAACRDYLFLCRWPDGFACRRCGADEVGAMHRARRVWQCKKCGAQTSVTAGTVMHNTQTPLRLWFWAAYLVATHHPGISAVQLQRQLGIARHETAWMLLHKLRRAMVAPEREPLKREIEIDEFFLGGHEKGLKGGRARGKKVLCAVAVEVRGRGSGRLRLGVIQDASGDSLQAFAQATTEPGAIVNSDGWLGYRGLPAVGFEHRPWSPSSVTAGEEPYLPRAHRAISNLKAWLHGTHRGTSRRHLPAYLDEYVFRHNRRRTPHAAFQTLLGLSAINQPSSYRDIIDQAA